MSRDSICPRCTHMQITSNRKERKEVKVKEEAVRSDEGGEQEKTKDLFLPPACSHSLPV